MKGRDICALCKVEWAVMSLSGKGGTARVSLACVQITLAVFEALKKGKRGKV